MHPVHGNILPAQGQQTHRAAETTTVKAETTVSTTDTETASRKLTDEIQLSPEAVRFLDSGDKPRGPQHSGSFSPPGHAKAGHSTAAQARAIIEADPTLSEQPFGQIVSQVARGVLSLADVTPDDEPGDEPVIGEGEGEGEGGEIPLADGDGTGGIIVAPGSGEETNTAPSEQTDTPEPTITNIIEETASSDEQLLQTPIAVVGDTSVSDGDLIDMLTEENSDQTA